MLLLLAVVPLGARRAARHHDAVTNATTIQRRTRGTGCTLSHGCSGLRQVTLTVATTRNPLYLALVLLCAGGAYRAARMAAAVDEADDRRYTASYAGR